MSTTLQGHALCRRLAMYTDGSIRLLIRTANGEEIAGYLAECGDDFITLYRDPARTQLECFIAINQVATIRLRHDDGPS